MSRSGEITRKILESALYRISAGRPRLVSKSRKLSIAAVAEEAGVSTATIHNRHPEIAEKVRERQNKSSRKLRDKKHNDLKVEKSKNKKLRAKIYELTDDLAKLLSINVRLMEENERLDAIQNSVNVTVLKGK